MHFSPATLLTTLSVLATQASAVGCYGPANNRLRFGELRGTFSNTEDIPTVTAMVDTFCGRVEGSTFYANTVSWHACASTDRIRGNLSKLHCGASCRDGCAAIGRSGGRGGGGEAAGSFCAAGCKDCPPDRNHIEFEIRGEGGVDRVASREACKAALYTEIGACERGAEQVHDGFYYRIAPGVGSCGSGMGEQL
jgi:hypothetical protein